MGVESAPLGLVAKPSRPSFRRLRGRHLQRTIKWSQETTPRRSNRRLAGKVAKKIGLDNLGTQQPCVVIYTRLLPGVTDVTDRAAYCGFYPWFIQRSKRDIPNHLTSPFARS